MSDRLARDEQIDEIISRHPNNSFGMVAEGIRIQDAKTAQLKDAECQAKISEIFEEIEQEYPLLRYCDPWWQALKEKYLEVKGG
jgi:hypothetical protein